MDVTQETYSPVLDETDMVSFNICKVDVWPLSCLVVSYDVA